MCLQAASAASVIVTVAQHYMAALECLLAGPGTFFVLQDSLLVFGHPSAERRILFLDTSKKRCATCNPAVSTIILCLMNSLPLIWIHPRRYLNPPRLASVAAREGLAVWPLPGAAPLPPHPADHPKSIEQQVLPAPTSALHVPIFHQRAGRMVLQRLTSISRLRKLSCCMGSASASLSLSYSSVSSASRKALLSTPPGLAPLASNVTSGRLEPRRAFVCSMRLPCESLCAHAMAAQQGQLQNIAMQACVAD